MKSFLTSSADPNKLSLTVKGFLVAIVPIVMILTGMTEAELAPVIDTVGQIVFYGASIIAAFQVLYGVARKLYLKRWSAK